MKKEFSAFLFFIVMSIPCMSYPFIYKIVVLRTLNPGQKPHYIIAASDFHDKSHTANIVQRNTVETLLARCNKDTTRVLVEDISSSGSGGRRSCGNFIIQSKGSLLGGLAHDCRLMGLDVNNVEYRYCRVASLGPILRNPQACLFDLVPVARIPIAALLNEVTATMNEIQSYNDGKVLNAYYRKNIKKVMPAIDALRLPIHAQKSVASYFDIQKPSVDQSLLLKTLLIFDSSLLDVKFVHDVINTHKNIVIIFAGGAHIDGVCTMLNKIGYKPIYNKTSSVMHEYNLKNCLGSHIVNGSFCIKPQPLDVTVLKELLGSVPN